MLEEKGKGNLWRMLFYWKGELFLGRLEEVSQVGMGTEEINDGMFVIRSL